MAKTHQLTFTNSSFYSASATAYISMGTSMPSALVSTEIQAQTICGVAGVFSHLWVKILANDRATSTITFRKNGADGSGVLSITGSTTGDFLDSTNTDTVSTGDLVNYKVATGAGGSTFLINAFTIAFAATTNTACHFVSTADTNITTATRFYFLAGTLSNETTEAQTQFKFKTAGTLKRLCFYTRTNSRADTTEVRTRINSTNGSMLVSVPSSTTGQFQDSSNTDTIAIGDLVNYTAIPGGGAGSITLNVFGSVFETTNSKHHVIASGTALLFSAETKYVSTGGQLAAQATELNTQSQVNFDYTASNLECYVSVNSFTAALTLTFRKNGTNGNQTISLTALTSGYFEDASNSDTLVSTDEVNCVIIAPTDAAKNMNMRTLGYLATVASASTPSRRIFPGIIR